MIFNLWGTTRRRSVTPGDKNYLLRISRGKCEYCGGDIIGRGLQAEIHHIVPFSSRGSDNYHNLIVLCPNCHSKAEHISKESFRSKIAYRVSKKASIQNIIVGSTTPKKTSVRKATMKATKAKKVNKNKTSKRKPTAKKAINRKPTVKRTKAKKTSIRKSPSKATKKTSIKKTPAKRTTARRK